MNEKRGERRMCEGLEKKQQENHSRALSKMKGKPKGVEREEIKERERERKKRER